MDIKKIETLFNRSIRLSFSKKKILTVFPVLVLAGLMIVLCRALAVNASDWVVFSLTFLPIFLCFGVLLATGAFLIKIYQAELLGLPVSLLKIIKESWQLLIGVSYLALPMILTYLLLWTTLGVFYLLREIPAVGPAFSVIFSFAPFLLVLGCLILSIFNALLLFFVTPFVALKQKFNLEAMSFAFSRIKENVFTQIFLFVSAALPLLAVVALLSLAAKLTGAAFLNSNEALTIALEWFFIMVPFSAILTPVVIFFFNFSAESYLLFERKKAL
ncbi:MAG: hypothetical protein WDZ28_04945 [Simkaniaceae bacterium]